MSFEEFQDGGHGGNLGYRNGTNSVILNLYNTPMPQVSAQSDLWFGRRCRLKNFKMASWQPSWISKRNDFGNSESLYHCEASHQVLAQSDMVWEEMSFDEFQVGSHGGHLEYRNGTI